MASAGEDRDTGDLRPADSAADAVAVVAAASATTGHSGSGSFLGSGRAGLVGVTRAGGIGLGGTRNLLRGFLTSASTSSSSGSMGGGGGGGDTAPPERSVQEACLRVSGPQRGGVWVVGRRLGVQRYLYMVIERCATMNEMHEVFEEVADLLQR